MAIFTNTFEGGTAGVAITTGNSGGASGTAFSSVPDANIAFSSAQKHEGSLSATFTSDAAGSTLRYTIGDEKNIAMRAYYYFENQNSGGNYGFLGLYTGGSSYGLLRASSTGRIHVYNVASAGIWDTDFLIPVGQWLRTEFIFERGTNASNGRYRAAFYLGNSPAAIADSGWLAGLNLGGDVGDSVSIRFGKGTGGTVAAGTYVDDIKVTTGVDYDGFIGASTPELAQPVVTIAAKSNPTTIGGTNGSITVTWPAVPGADHYESDLRTGTVTSGFVADDTNAVSPKTYTGLSAGNYTVAVRAKVS